VPQAFPPLGQEYEPFLYAIVCNEGNGMPLTMVSAIARSGADPWKEAARIAKLPKALALDALARIIPECVSAENAAIANRLFALLPVARDSAPFRVAVGVKTDARSMNPLVLGVVALLVCLVLASAFRKTTSSGVAQHESPSPPPVADKADP